MNLRTFGVALLGAGNIAEPYAADLETYPHLALKGVFDVDQAKAAHLAAKSGIAVYKTLEQMLNDPAVDIVANLSAHHAHYDLTKQCLNAGKHVHSEKPLALHSDQAWELVALAEALSLRLSCSPFTWLGNASLALRKAVLSGAVGEPRIVYAEVNWGFIESWHPSPEAFHTVGALWDVGVYPIALTTSLFGPVRQVQAIARTLKPERVSKDGAPFTLDGPDWLVSAIDFSSGVTMRLTTSFYTETSRQRASLEVHGDQGTVRVSDWLNFDADVEVAARGGEWENIAYEKCGKYIRWGLALADLAQGIGDGRPPLASGAHAAHVVDVLEACDQSARTNQPVAVNSTFEASNDLD